MLLVYVILQKRISLIFIYTKLHFYVSKYLCMVLDTQERNLGCIQLNVDEVLKHILDFI